MKTCLAVCFSVVFGGILTALGQMPAAAPHPHSLSLHVEPVSTGGTSDVDDHAHTKSAGGILLSDPTKRVQETKSKQTETNEQSEGIRIDVRNLSSLPDTAQVEWYFMARLVQGNQGDYILDEGAKPITVAPGGTVTIPVESKKVTETLTRKANTHFHGGKAKVDHSSGLKDQGSLLTGWMVRVVADNRVIEARGSKETYEERAKDLSKLPIIK